MVPFQKVKADVNNELIGLSIFNTRVFKRVKSISKKHNVKISIKVIDFTVVEIIEAKQDIVIFEDKVFETTDVKRLIAIINSGVRAKDVKLNFLYTKLNESISKKGLNKELRLNLIEKRNQLKKCRGVKNV